MIQIVDPSCTKENILGDIAHYISYNRILLPINDELIFISLRVWNCHFGKLPKNFSI